MAEQYIMTKKGYDEAVEKLKYLQTVKRQEIVDRIAEARSHGDLSENAEYDAARNEQAANEGEIVELDYKIKNAVIQEENNDTTSVHVGSKVRVYDLEMDEREPGEIVRDVAEKYYDGPDPIGKTHIREGVVVRIVNRPKFAAYKHKNFEFKILEGIIKDTAAAPDMEEAQEVEV